MVEKVKTCNTCSPNLDIKVGQHTGMAGWPWCRRVLHACPGRSWWTLDKNLLFEHFIVDVVKNRLEWWTQLKKIIFDNSSNWHSPYLSCVLYIYRVYTTFILCTLYLCCVHYIYLVWLFLRRIFAWNKCMDIFLIQWTKHSQIWHEDFSAFEPFMIIDGSKSHMV